MRRYMYEYGYRKEDFAPFTVNAHANGMNNPYAMFHMKVTPETYAKARMIADPINLLDSSPVADGGGGGAGARRLGPGSGKPVIRVAASAVATDAVALHDRRDPLVLEAAALSAYRAYEQAGVGPEDVDLFELHDAFSIMACTEPGGGGVRPARGGVRLALDGEITLQGRIPVATMGGLKARGHPVGATGVYQVVEVVQQLRGEAGANQVPNARVGMAQNIGGSGATVITHVLIRDS